MCMKPGQDKLNSDSSMQSRGGTAPTRNRFERFSLNPHACFCVTGHVVFGGLLEPQLLPKSRLLTDFHEISNLFSHRLTPQCAVSPHGPKQQGQLKMAENCQNTFLSYRIQKWYLFQNLSFSWDCVFSLVSFANRVQHWKEASNSPLRGQQSMWGMSLAQNAFT